MFQLKFPGMQALSSVDPTVAVFRAAISGIAEQRVTGFAEVGPDLVHAACHQSDLD